MTISCSNNLKIINYRQLTVKKLLKKFKKIVSNIINKYYNYKRIKYGNRDPGHQT